MADEGLLIRIGADVDSAVTNISKVPAALVEVDTSAKKTAASVVSSMADMSSAVTQSSKSYNELNSSLDKIESAFNDKWNPVVEKAEKSVVSLQKQVKSFGDGVSTFKPPDYFKKTGDEAEKGLNKVTAASQNARYAVLDIGHIFRDLPYAISNPAILAGPFDRATQALTTLKQESAATGQSFGQLVSGALMGPGGILIAVEIVTSALIIFGPALIRAFSGADAAAQKIDYLAQHHRELVATMEDAAKSAGGEVFNLRVLEKAATDVTKPMEVRVKAVKELQKEYPNYLNGLSQEAILNGQAASQINLVAEALYKKAFAEAASSKAADMAKKGLDLELRENFLINERIKSEAALAKAKAAALNSGQAGGFQLQGYEEKHLAKIDQLILQNIHDQVANNDEIKFYTDKVAEAYDVTQKLTIEHQKKAKVRKTEADIEAELARSMEKINLEEQALGKNLDPERISAIESAIKQLLDIKVSATSDSIKKLSDRLTELSQKTYAVKGLSTEKEESAPVGSFADPGGTFDKKFQDPTGGALHILDQIVKKQKEATEGIKKYQAGVADLGKSLVGTFENVFTELITGGGNALKIFGQYIQTIIMKLIAAAAISAILSAVTGGFGAGAKGGGFSALFGKISGFGSLFPAHAAGGITTGPHLAMVGDNASGKEAIIPFERMGEFLNNFGGGHNIEISGKLVAEGDHLVTVISRTNAKQKRAYG